MGHLTCFIGIIMYTYMITYLYQLGNGHLGVISLVRRFNVLSTLESIPSGLCNVTLEYLFASLIHCIFLCDIFDGLSFF